MKMIIRTNIYGDDILNIEINLKSIIKSYNLIIKDFKSNTILFNFDVKYFIKIYLSSIFLVKIAIYNEDLINLSNYLKIIDLICKIHNINIKDKLFNNSEYDFTKNEEIKNEIIGKKIINIISYEEQNSLTVYKKDRNDIIYLLESDVDILL